MPKPYRLLVCGDREYQDQVLVRDTILQYLDKHPEMEVIMGCAKGADEYAWQTCQELNIPCSRYYAEWQKYGPPAGPIRNKKMVEQEPNMVLAFHDNIDYSKGTLDCKKQAQRRGILVKVICHEENN